MPRMRIQPVPSPQPTSNPRRQITVFLAIAYGLALTIALVLPHAGIAPLISILVPVTAVVLTVAVAVPRGERRAVWAGVGLGRFGGRGDAEAQADDHDGPQDGGDQSAAFGVVRFSALEGVSEKIWRSSRSRSPSSPWSSSVRRSAGAATCSSDLPRSRRGGGPRC